MENKKTILLVEDSEKLRNTVTELLQSMYHVVGVSEALPGIDICKKQMPDLILLDIMLEGTIDGFSFLRIVKNDDHLLHIPIILISALSSEDVIVDGLRLGANDYLVKPFSLTQLMLKIRNLLHTSEQAKQKAIVDASIPFKLSTETNDLVNKLEVLLDESLSKDKHLSIKELATKLSVSQSTLERMVKKRFNVTPNQYLLMRKLEKADLLIRTQTDIPIKEISFSLGFSSVSYFCKTYKAHFGRRPTDIKK
jgi:DNA-binding response OmpR family regulator